MLIYCVFISLLVGAPRDNVTGVMSLERPGAVYNCDVSTLECQQMRMDPYGES